MGHVHEYNTTHTHKATKWVRRWMDQSIGRCFEDPIEKIIVVHAFSPIPISQTTFLPELGLEREGYGERSHLTFRRPKLRIWCTIPILNTDWQKLMIVNSDFSLPMPIAGMFRLTRSQTSHTQPSPEGWALDHDLVMPIYS